MSERNFRDLLEAHWAEGKFVCVGLDVDVEKFPRSVRGISIADRIVDFNCRIVEKPRAMWYARISPISPSMSGMAPTGSWL